MANVLGGHSLWVDKKVQNREVVIFFRSNFKLFYTHVFAFPPLKNVKNVFLALERRPANGKCGKCRSRDPPFRLRGKKIGSALRIWDQ